MGGAGAGVGACSGCVGGGSAGVPASGGDEKRFDMNIPPMNPLPAMAMVLRSAGAGRLILWLGLVFRFGGPRKNKKTNNLQREVVVVWL